MTYARQLAMVWLAWIIVDRRKHGLDIAVFEQYLDRLIQELNS